MFEKIFHLKEHNTNVRTECIAGVTTFMTAASDVYKRQLLHS